MAKYRVVSIDGGGIRGLVTTVLLQRIVATPGLEKLLVRAPPRRLSPGGFIATSSSTGWGHRSSLPPWDRVDPRR